MDEKIKQTTVLALFAAFISACYLLSYWGSFEIDVFQFAGLTDFAKLAIAPLMTSSVSVAVGILLQKATRADQRFPSGGGAETSIGIFIRKHRSAILFTCAALAGLCAVSSAQPARWIAAAFLMAPWTVNLAEDPAIVSVLQDERLRKFLCNWSLMFAAMALFWGGLNAKTIIDGYATRIVVPTGAANQLSSDANNPLGLIGFVAGTYFIYVRKTDTVVLMKQVDNVPLVLARNPLRRSFSESMGAMRTHIATWFRRQ